MKHIVITRCNFSDNLLFEKYLGVIKKYFIPGLNNQTNKNSLVGFALGMVGQILSAVILPLY